MKIKIGIIQSSFSNNSDENSQKVINYIEQAHKLGAHIVLPPELYLTSYFCKTQDENNFSYALDLDNKYLRAIRAAAQAYKIVIPWSFFEKSGPHYFNSVLMIDADGTKLGLYRKSHIPDGPGYQEKFYFRPGNTGFKVFKTRFGSLGVGICWDQWFPEAARSMVLQGAEVLLYPTAIGSEPHAPWLSTKEPWQRVMKGHAVANMVPVVAANRIGTEGGQTFYGSSFICDEFGHEITNMAEEEGLRVVEVDKEKAARHRASFGFFRDRRIDLYKDLLK